MSIPHVDREGYLSMKNREEVNELLEYMSSPHVHRESFLSMTNWEEVLGHNVLLRPSTLRKFLSHVYVLSSLTTPPTVLK